MSFEFSCHFAFELKGSPIPKKMQNSVLNCDICDQDFSTIPLKKIHMEQEHKKVVNGKKKWYCNHCSATFQKKCGLVDHIDKKHSNKGHICRICGSRFSQMQDLIEHRHTVHGTELDLTKHGLFQQTKSALNRCLETYSVSFLDENNPMNNVEQIRQDEELMSDAQSLLQSQVSCLFCLSS